ncbi:hypothetical protein BX600DRAFT_439602 [Xylariales sp. PMI_506]|nr:hypothetical protein BX600DRAFT_439602 [Xylariales sp. PMI_506]
MYWQDSLVDYQSNEADAERFSGVKKEIRSSTSARIPSQDKVASCLSNRVKSLLGNVQHDEIEPMQLIRYGGGERFRSHQDWSDPYESKASDSGSHVRYYNRLTSTFAYLEDNCTGGETYFPRVQSVGLDADGDKFSRTESGEGLLVRPRRGNAILWKNLLANGTGDPRLLHASLPIKSGRKIGMNIFSLYYTDKPMLGA